MTWFLEGFKTLFKAYTCVMCQPCSLDDVPYEFFAVSWPSESKNSMSSPSSLKNQPSPLDWLKLSSPTIWAYDTEESHLAQLDGAVVIQFPEVNPQAYNSASSAIETALLSGIDGHIAQSKSNVDTDNVISLMKTSPRATFTPNVTFKNLSFSSTQPNNVPPIPDERTSSVSKVLHDQIDTRKLKLGAASQTQNIDKQPDVFLV